MKEIDKRVETAIRNAVRQRNYRRVRDRALARLRKLHPDDYSRLFEEERAKDEQEGKAWLDITGRTNASMGAPTQRNNGEATEGLSGSEQEGELAGETIQ